jgi:hypothetical protein
MQRSVPTYEDAELVLKLYELRREEKLRAARDWFVAKFFPSSVSEIQTLASAGGQEYAYYRMVTSYWDMAASFVVRGVLNADLFLDSATEMVMVWAKLEPLAPKIREAMTAPGFLANVEKAIVSSPQAQERLRLARQRVATLRQRFAGSAAKS